MNIIAKQINFSNIVCMFREGSVRLPEPGVLYSGYSADEAKGSLFSDNVSMASRVFELPARGIQWVFEPSKVRLEERKHQTPDESNLAHELSRMMGKLYPDAVPTAYGFNYDVIYRLDSVVPADDIMKRFLKPETVENVRHFGWQYSVSKEKGKRFETYFFKVVSPIEIALHANIHLGREWPKREEALVQKQFEKGYAEIDEAVKQISFI